jgi:hypothetical protein
VTHSDSTAAPPQEPVLFEAPPHGEEPGSAAAKEAERRAVVKILENMLIVVVVVVVLVIVWRIRLRARLRSAVRLARTWRGMFSEVSVIYTANCEVSVRLLVVVMDEDADVDELLIRP